MPRERKLKWVFALALLALVLNSVVAYRNTVSLISDNRWVQHTRRVLTALEGLTLGLRAGDDEVAPRIGALARQTADNPRQQARIAELRGLLAGGDAAGALDVVKEMRAEEGRLLDLRSAAADASITRAAVTFTLASGLALAMLAAAYYFVLRDADERRRWEESLRGSEEKVRLLLESSGEGIYGVDTQGRCTFCNPAALKMLGYPRVADVLGRDMHVLIHHGRPDGSPYPVIDCPIYLAMRSGTGAHSEDDVFWRADGKSFPVEYRSHPVRREGEIIGAVVTFADVSERRLSEQTVRIRDRSLRAISQGLFITDPSRSDEPIVYVNEAFRQITGYDPGESVGRDIRFLLGPETDPRAAETLRAAFREGAECAVELRAYRKDGTPFWCGLSVSPVQSPSGRVTHFVGVMTDVTGRRAAEESLRRSEERYRSLITASAAIVWNTDAAGELTADQPGWSEFTGQSPDELKVYGWLDAIHPEDRAETMRSWARAVEARAPYQIEHRLRRKDGEYRLMLVRAVPIHNADGTIREWVGVHTDVTEQKAAEEALVEAKEAAEAASRSKSTFLANMSHELRTPLNAIIGYSEMLQEEAEDDGNESAVADLQKIHAAGRHLLGLINDILDLSKIEAGKMDLFLETFDVGPVVDGVADTVRPLVEKNNNTLEVSRPDGLGKIHADLTKTRQALLNLLANASKFTQDGKVTLEAGREQSNGRDWFVFRVRDTGIGMTADQVSRLFRPFTQADPSTTRKYGGTGLGLTITRRFCQMMGGDVEVASEAAAGSVFTVRLPAVVADRPPQSMADDPLSDNTDGDGSVVLVIDDDPTVRELIRRTLEKEGFRVRHASGGEEGLKLARQLRPDAITLDVMMPGMDGWAVLSALKSDPDLADTPVVMVTIVDDKSLGYALGASDYLTKPIDRKRLTSVLAKYRRDVNGNVLVVDDDQLSRQVVAQTLEADGWTVTEAENGVVAFERLAGHRPDLILLDLMMPEMDGFEFTHKLRLDPRWRDIPILVVTAQDITEDDRRRLNGQVLGVLKKAPATPDGLLAEIRRLLTSRRPPAPTDT